MNQPTHQHHVEKTTQNANTLPDRPVNDLRPTSMDDFNIIDQVGEGTYGRVFKACHKKSGKLCALKMVFPIEEEDGLSFTAIREIKYLQQLANNPNVITLLGTFFTAAGELVLCFEYMENDLSGLLSLKDVEFSPAQIKCLMKQILEGLHQCHVAGIMHRDIKAANLLVTDGVLKLADFGLATNYTRRPVFSTNVVTLWYRAPELLLGITKYKAKVDIWSAGCIFIELLTRQSPFPGRDERHQMELICKTCGSPTEENWAGVTQLEGYKLLQGMPQYRNRLREIFSKIDPYALDLICKMLALDPESRITASQALDHDFFWTNPMPCQPSELPAYPSMHEYEAKRTRQTEQKQAKRQKGESYRAPTEQASAYPGVRRPQIRVPGWQPPAPNQRPPVKPALNGNMPGSAIVDRNAGQQYPSSIQPYPQQQQQHNRHWEREGYRSSGGHVNGDSGRIGEKGTAVQNGTSRTNNGRRSGAVPPPADVPRRGGYPQHPVDSRRGGGSSMDIDRRRGGSEVGMTGVRLEKTKERMDTEVEEGEILMLNRPPSDHSLNDAQLQPPTGLSSFDHLAEFDGVGLGGGSPSAFATNRVMVGTAAGKRKREEVK